MQIDLTFRNNLSNVKCTVLHKPASGVCYITRRAPKVGIRMRVRGGREAQEGAITHRFRYRTKSGEALRIC